MLHFYCLWVRCKITETDSFLHLICFWGSLLPEERKQVFMLTPVTLFYLPQIEFVWLSPLQVWGRKPESSEEKERGRDGKRVLLMTLLINIESLSSCITVESWCGMVVELVCVCLLFWGFQSHWKNLQRPWSQTDSFARYFPIDLLLSSCNSSEMLLEELIPCFFPPMFESAHILSCWYLTTIIQGLFYYLEKKPFVDTPFLLRVKLQLPRIWKLPKRYDPSH